MAQSILGSALRIGQTKEEHTFATECRFVGQRLGTHITRLRIGMANRNEVVRILQFTALILVLVLLRRKKTAVIADHHSWLSRSTCHRQPPSIGFTFRLRKKMLPRLRRFDELASSKVSKPGLLTIQHNESSHQNSFSFSLLLLLLLLLLLERTKKSQRSIGWGVENPTHKKSHRLICQPNKNRNNQKETYSVKLLSE